jgi:hypothetical protein
MRWTRALGRWLRRLLGLRVPYRVEHVEDVPEDLRAGVVYLVGEGEHVWCAALACPCGCGATIQLNLVASTRPCWAVRTEPRTRTVTLHPSVWRTSGCQSHFFLRAGYVEWCGTT